MAKKLFIQKPRVVTHQFYVESDLPYYDRFGMQSRKSKGYYVYEWNKDRTAHVKRWVDEEKKSQSNTE
jgi:hypothetical protein